MKQEWLDGCGNVRSKDSVFADELGTRVKIIMKECLQDKRLHWTGHLQKMKKIMVVPPEGNLRNYETGLLKVIWKNRKSTRTYLITETFGGCS